MKFYWLTIIGTIACVIAQPLLVVFAIPFLLLAWLGSKAVTRGQGRPAAAYPPSPKTP